MLLVKRFCLSVLLIVLLIGLCLGGQPAFSALKFSAPLAGLVFVCCFSFFRLLFNQKVQLLKNIIPLYDLFNIACIYPVFNPRL